MTFFRVAIIFASVTLASTVPALAQSAKPRGSSNVANVYLMRGFMNVFSLGMDTLAEKLQRRGLKAEVYNHVSGASVVSEIIAQRKAGDRSPIVLIGHSLGASEVVSMANDLSTAGISVDLVVPIDAVVTTHAFGTTKRIVNYYMSDGVGAPVVAGAGFKGRLQNVDVRGMGVGHIFIDKSEKVQDMVIGQVVAATSRSAPKPSGTAAPTAAASSETTASVPTLR